MLDKRMTERIQLIQNTEWQFFCIYKNIQICVLKRLAQPNRRSACGEVPLYQTERPKQGAHLEEH